jgi:endonuclease YncB( thermonuclease family)
MSLGRLLCGVRTDRNPCCGAVLAMAVLAAGLAVTAANRATAQTATAADGCAFPVIGTGEVAAVTDGRSFVLTDGREIRLADIEVPPLPASDGAGSDIARAARTALAALVAGQSVELRQHAAATDRYGRIVAHAAISIGDRRRPVAEEMLARGFARVAAETETQGCAAILHGRESEARRQSLGLWAEPYYSLVEAGNSQRLLAARGHFTLAEGKILSVRESGGVIYLNFGRRWSEALTVTISKRRESIFTAAGLQPKKLENRRIRVRGWVEERSGPRIEAVRPEQIELAERN